MARDDDSEENDSAAVPPLDQVKSYAAYAVRSLKRHTRLAVVAALVVTAGTGAAVTVWPRTYTCTTVLSAVDNKVLDGDRSTEALRGAEEVILNHDNIGALVDEVKLTKRWETTLPPASRFKQKVSSWLRGGEVSERDKRDALVQMVQNALSVIPPGWNQNKLTISADWNDPKIAADLAEAADQSFLRARHVAEISTITEYIEILEGHATELRAEIDKLADQNQRVRDDKLAELTHRSAPAAKDKPASVVRAPGPAAPKIPVEDLSELKSQLELKQRALKELEDNQQRRRADAEAALTQLRTKFTDAHPMVVAAENNVASLSQDTPQIAALRSDVTALNAALKSKSAAADLAASGGPRVAGVPVSAGIQGASGVEPLPADIMRMMQDDNEDLDPAVGAQFKGAVSKYAAIRDKIGTARVDLDTAQAAFRHRYQIIIPAEAPSKPSKPKVPLILAGGVLASLVIGWLLAILAELRTGRVVERWQVYSLGIPLLGELRWPPSSGG